MILSCTSSRVLSRNDLQQLATLEVVRGENTLLELAADRGDAIETRNPVIGTKIRENTSGRPRSPNVLARLQYRRHRST